jgi:hypothetical protein
VTRHAAIGANGAFRALMMFVAVVVVLIPIVGLRLLAEDTESVSTTGDVSLTPGHRMLYVVDGHVASLALRPDGTSAGAPVVSELLCARIHASNGTGLCLRRNNAVSWSATILDRNLEATTTLPLAGTPALARVSPSGRMVAWTALEKGTSLRGSFSAVTSILDTQTKRQVEDLEAFGLRQGKQKLAIAGHQVWGVAFADDDRFYATVSAGTRTWLAVGSVSKRQLQVLREDVSGAALSPNGKRLALLHKGRVAVLDLTTKKLTDLDDRRRVTDQPVWLDPRTIAYVVRDDAGATTIWTTRPTPGRRPELLVSGAESPSPV